MKTRTPIRSIPAAWLLLAAIATAFPAAAEAPDSAWILGAIARPAPARTPFLEVRESPMLSAPLRVAGEYSKPDEATLVREVRAPYAETTTLRAGRATVQRAGRAARSFALSRAPELAALQGTFGAMLSADGAALERDYRIATDGTRERWTMTLTPREAALAARVRGIVLRGDAAGLRCVETRPVEGAVQRILLADAALAAGDQDDAAALAALCDPGGTP